MITDRLTKWQALGIVGLMWAAIYLPALGTLEIKGEEGRRILPAITMLDTGKWIVPQIGGVDYLSKPPLINWLVAAAFKISGGHSEWAARMPCALCMLAFGLGTIWLLAEWLSPAGALIAAVFALTNIGFMEKGRLAEIEGLYAPLAGLATLAWLSAWRAEAGAWRTWIVPWIVLGVGLLAKGPLHVVFFYGVVVAVLSKAGRLKELLRPAHFAGVAIMLGIFACWAVPYLRETAADRVGAVWKAQFEGRMEVNEGFHAAGWALNIPRGLANYIPWAVLLPLLWRTGIDDAWDARDQAILRGGRLALALGFLLVSLAPGGLPRYTLPLAPLASALLAFTLTRNWASGLPAWLPLAWARTLLIGLAVTTGGALAAALAAEDWKLAAVVAVGIAAGLAFNRRRLFGGSDPAVTSPLPGLYPAAHLATASAVVMAALTWEYAVGATPRLLREQDVRPLADEINQAVRDSSEPVCALAPGFLPFLFYLERPPTYAQTIDETPKTASYLLLRDKELGATTPKLSKAGFDSQVALRVTDKNRGTWALLRLKPRL